MVMSQPEAWLGGPVPKIGPALQPVAHSFIQVRRDLEGVVPLIEPHELWTAPGGAASLGFHLQHLAGATDRLLTYAQGNALSEDQLAALAAEKNAADSGASAADLIDHVDDTLDRVLDTVKRTDDDALTAVRHVGRARVPSTVIGLLFHIAEHTQRHAGQVVTTAKIVRSGST